MRLILILLIPAIFALSFLIIPRRDWRADLFVIAGIVILEIVVFGGPSENRGGLSKIAWHVLVFVFPWVGCGIFRFLTKDKKASLLLSIGFFMIYLIMTVIGLAVGDITGAIPQ